ncbi:MAG: patatin-like phospholipase family protein [Thermovirgaceae bacterium]|nr:patatin-like phospholipase family protein [Thermovirgaceae bacterium]
MAGVNKGVVKGFKNRKIGLALGGGAVLGAAHIGVLKALKENDVSIACLAGTSVGAFVGAFCAFGMEWEEIDKIARDLKWLDVSRVSISQYGLLSNRKLGDLIIEHVGDVSFDQAKIPLAMVATDITTGEKVVLREGSVASAVMASSCIPGIFVPVEMDGRLLVDGGIVENVPLTPLQEMGADLIIGVDLNSGRRDERPQNIVEVLLRSFNFMLASATRLQTEEADILIQPDLSGFNMYDMDQEGDLFEAGYLEAMKMLRKVL